MLLLLPQGFELPDVLHVALVQLPFLPGQEAIALGLEVGQLGGVPRHQALDLGLQTADCKCKTNERKEKVKSEK